MFLESKNLYNIVRLSGNNSSALFKTMFPLHWVMCSHDTDIKSNRSFTFALSLLINHYLWLLLPVGSCLKWFAVPDLQSPSFLWITRPDVIEISTSFSVMMKSKLNRHFDRDWFWHKNTRSVTHRHWSPGLPYRLLLHSTIPQSVKDSSSLKFRSSPNLVSSSKTHDIPEQKKSLF